MIARLSPREKILALVVGGVSLVMAFLWLGDWYLRSSGQLRRDIASRSKQLHLMQALLEERTFWEERDAWVRAKQPPAATDDTAGVQLLDEVKSLALKYGVQLENQVIRPPEPQPAAVAVAVDLDAKCTWEPFLSFLHELQSPDRFVAMENANLRVDAEDPTQLRGHFRIARWHAAP